MNTDDAGAPRRRRGVSMATRLAATVLGVAFVSLIVATFVGINAGQRLGTNIYEDRLDALRSSGSIDVAARIQSLVDMTEALAASPQAAAAIEQFSVDLSILDVEDRVGLRDELEQLADLYEEEYLEPLRAGGENVQFRDVATEDPGALYLQAVYSLPSETFDDPILVDDGGDGSAWTETHTVIHPVYRDVVQELELLDVLLVSFDRGRVVYTASKRPDLGTSLEVGPFSGSVVARAATNVFESPDEGAHVTDLDFYNAVPETPVGAVASAVRDRRGGVIGAIVLTYNGRMYTDVMQAVVTASETDEELVGADMYLIGFDGTTRSDPREFIDDEDLFLDQTIEAGVLPAADRSTIERNDTTVLVQPAVDATFLDALDGDTAISDRSSMTGQEVAGSVAAVPSEYVRWFTVSEIGTENAESSTQDFRNALIVGSSIFVILVAFAAVAWANGVMRPVRAISDRLTRRDESLPPLQIPDRSPVEFHRLSASFASMAGSLRSQRNEVATAREERLSTMEQLLPASVAKRIADGNVEALDEVPSATVLVVVVLGLGALAQANDDAHGDEDANRERIDRLHAELDDLAFEYGVDRIKVVGDAYFGACGHDRPYIDHAPRVVSFAREVIDLVREVSAEWPAHLEVAVGVHTGPVTVGLSGGARLVYDVWGDTVTTAHHLARRAHAAEILVSEATRMMLPENVESRPAPTVGDAQAWIVALDDSTDEQADGQTDETGTAREPV